MILLGLLWLFLNAGSHVSENSMASARLHNILTLRNSLRQYQSDWDCLPQKLSDLVPNYIKLDHATVLFGPTSSVGCAKAQFRLVPRTIDAVTTADLQGPYCYLGSDARNSILLFEKPTAWREYPKQWWGYGHVNVLYSNWSVKLVSERELFYAVTQITNGLEMWGKLGLSPDNGQK